MKKMKHTTLCAACLGGLTLCAIAGMEPGAGDDGDFTLGPDYTNAPELAARPGVPKGTTYQFTMDSAGSKFYPGISKANPGVTVPYQRRVWVYVPSQYVAGTPVPFLVAQDGGGYVRRMTNILDNMIADRRLPVMAAVFIDSGGSDGPGSERGLEYDTVSGKYAEFVEAEVLPKISRDYHITFTQDPDGRAAMGGSSGGAAAFSMGWFHPDLYHRILTYSGTYVNQQSPVNPASPHGAWEFHEHLIPESAAKPLRVWMEVGERDNRYTDAESTYHNWVLANQHMAAALKAKGYHYRLVLCLGAVHVDSRAVAETLPGALAWLWRDYAAK
jgi:enterochelin esterase-like enzyme